MQCLGIIVEFALTVVVARMLGAKLAGTYFLAITLVTIAATVGRIGLDNSVMRFIAEAKAAANWSLAKGALQTSLILATCGAALAAVVVLVSSNYLAGDVFDIPELGHPLRIAASAIIPIALYVLFAHGFRSIGKVGDAVAIMSVFTPVLALLLFPLLIPIWGLAGATTGYAVATIVTLAVAAVRWWQCTPQLRSIRGEIALPTLLKSSVPLFWATIFQLINKWSPLLFLAYFSSASDVGVFNVSHKTGFLISSVLVALNSIAAPKFAQLYLNSDLAGLAQSARTTAKWATVAAAPVSLLFLVFPTELLSLFGSQFVGGSVALRILVIAQFINVCTGSVQYLLMMTGHEQLMRTVMVSSTIANLVLCVFLIPTYGLVGAAAVVGITVVAQNILAAYFVWRKLGFLALPFGPIRRSN